MSLGDIARSSGWPVQTVSGNRGITRVDILEKVLEKLATSQKTTIVIDREHDGKMRVTSGSWDGEKVFLRPGRRDTAPVASVI
jgi:hypothetical protein